MPRFDQHDENAPQPAGQEKEKDMTSIEPGGEYWLNRCIESYGIRKTQ